MNPLLQMLGMVGPDAMGADPFPGYVQDPRKIREMLNQQGGTPQGAPGVPPPQLPPSAPLPPGGGQFWRGDQGGPLVPLGPNGQPLPGGPPLPMPAVKPTATGGQMQMDPQFAISQAGQTVADNVAAGAQAVGSGQNPFAGRQAVLGGMGLPLPGGQPPSLGAAPFSQFNGLVPPTIPTVQAPAIKPVTEPFQPEYVRTGGVPEINIGRQVNSPEDRLAAMAEGVFNRSMAGMAGTGFNGNTPVNMAALAPVAQGQSEAFLRSAADLDKNRASLGVANLGLQGTLGSSQMQSQAELNKADITGRYHLAGQEAAHSPEAIRGQAIKEMALGLATGKYDPKAMKSSIDWLNLNNSRGGAGQPASGGARAVDPQAFLEGQHEANTLQSQVAGYFGEGQPGKDFKPFKPGELTVDKMHGLADFIAGGKLKGEAYKQFVQDIKEGKYGNRLEIEKILGRTAAAQYIESGALHNDPKIGPALRLEGAAPGMGAGAGIPGYVPVPIGSEDKTAFNLMAKPAATWTGTGGNALAGAYRGAPYNTVVLRSGVHVPLQATDVKYNPLEQATGTSKEYRDKAPTRLSPTAQLLYDLGE